MARATKTGKRGGGEKAQGALLLLEAAASLHGESPEIAEGCAARVPEGKAVVEDETAAAASPTMATIRARGKVIIRAETEERGYGGRRAVRVCGKGAGVVEMVAKGEGAVPRPREEDD